MALVSSAKYFLREKLESKNREAVCRSLGFSFAMCLQIEQRLQPNKPGHCTLLGVARIVIPSLKIFVVNMIWVQCRVGSVPGITLALQNPCRIAVFQDCMMR
eukprot:1160897-Pelagomonas_calceolata.AAC.7